MKMAIKPVSVRLNSKTLFNIYNYKNLGIFVIKLIITKEHNITNTIICRKSLFDFFLVIHFWLLILVLIINLLSLLATAATILHIGNNILFLICGLLSHTHKFQKKIQHFLNFVTSDFWITTFQGI